MTSPSSREVFRVLAAHEKSKEISQRVYAVARAAAAQQRPDYLTGETVAERGVEFPPLEPTSAETPFGNALTILDRGAQNRTEWAFLSCAVSQAAAECIDQGDFEPLPDLAWLSAHTPCNAWLFIDDHIADDVRESFWEAAADFWSKLPYPEQRAVALGASAASSPEAAAALSRLHKQTSDPVLSAVLAARLPGQSIEGELSSSRNGSLGTLLLALSGLLLLRAAFRTFNRYVLGSKRRARLTISPGGIKLEHEHSLLGRKISEGQRLVPFEHLVSIERESRYDGARLYGGLFALTIGTYFGTVLLTDGARVPGGSPSLLGIGAAFLTLGILLDFLLTRFSEYRTGRACLSLRTKAGGSFVLRGLDAKLADRTLRRVRQQQGV